MDDIRNLATKMILNDNELKNPQKKSLFEAFLNKDYYRELTEIILKNQEIMIKDWELINRIDDIKQQVFLIPNGTVGKPYNVCIDFKQNQWTDITSFEINGLNSIGGIDFDSDTNTISGIPETSGDYKIRFKFRLSKEAEDSVLHEKLISFIINPNPKSLWKNIPSDLNDEYWKEDDTSSFSKIANKHILVSSKRGRSHANIGSYRDDHYAFCDLKTTNWSLVAVADGAGSAKISRQGSRLACDGIIEYFEKYFNKETCFELEKLIQTNQTNSNDEVKKELNISIYNLIGKGAKYVHDKLEDFANSTNNTLNDLNTTLIFTLFKTFEFGTVILSFSVGDCPIAMIPNDFSEVILMNWLDVGEYGGGTRFITTSEIFASQKFASRINYKLVNDFKFLMLMTDGIYDPKFSVEANLEKVEKWKEFIDDLNGNNEMDIKVELNSNNENIENQLSSWMDFWSPGNHDDRTLAIIF